jgi:hypothetical protein
MKTVNLLPIIFLTILSCSKRKEVFNKPIITSENPTDRFFPKAKTVEKFDTLIVDKNLEISITKSYLDSFVTNEFENEGKKQVDKYRDAEISLKIKQNNKILLDTLFRKENFNNYINKNFQNIAVFHGYWLDGIDNEKIQFFGTISKPETDWAFDFHHNFYFKNKSLKTEIVVENEE